MVMTIRQVSSSSVLLVIFCVTLSTDLVASQKTENSTSLLTTSSSSSSKAKNGNNSTSPSAPAKLVRGQSAKFQRYGFDDKVFMLTVVGSSGMNFSSYFHMVGENCLDKHPRAYETILKSFEMCLDAQDQLVQASVWNAELRISPQPCVEWKIYRNCYSILSLRYKECLSKPTKNGNGSNSKVATGVNALSFLEIYGDAICKRRDVDEVNRFADCFWRQQEPIVDCSRQDKINSLCPQLTRVQDCFDVHFDTRGVCRDLQPIDSRYLKTLFTEISYKLDCSTKPIQTIDSEWPLLRPNQGTTRPPGKYEVEEWGRPSPSKPWPNYGGSGRDAGTVIHVHGNHIQILTGTPERGYQVDIVDRSGSRGRDVTNSWKQVKTDDSVILTKIPEEPELAEEDLRLVDNRKPSHELDRLTKI